MCVSKRAIRATTKRGIKFCSKKCRAKRLSFLPIAAVVRNPRCMQVSVHGYRAPTILMLAAFPAVILAVCPVMDSPFYEAKCSVLFAFGAAGCLSLPKDSFASETVLPLQEDRIKPRVLLFSFIAWVVATSIATAYAHAWKSAWRPLAEYGSAIAVVAAMIRLRIERSTLLFCIAVSASALACLGARGLGWVRSTPPIRCVFFELRDVECLWFIATPHRKPIRLAATHAVGGWQQQGAYGPRRCHRRRCVLAGVGTAPVAIR